MDKNKPKQRADDRVFVFEEKEGEKPKNSAGLADPRLWKGGNALHAVFDNQSGLWGFKYDAGALPVPLKQRFTSFALAKKAAEVYFGNRGIEVVKVLD